MLNRIQNAKLQGVYNESLRRNSFNFLSTMKVDSIKDIRYRGKSYQEERCVCGQKIATAYIFKTSRIAGNV